MRTKSAYSITVILFGWLLVSGVSGCTLCYTIEVSGVVRNAEDGTPLAGVLVTLETNEAIRDGDSFPIVTGPDGTFRASFVVPESALRQEQLPKWSLTFFRREYQEQSLDISLKQKPASARETIKISLECRLKRMVVEDRDQP